MAEQSLTPQQAFVTALYDGLLDRAPSSSEVQSWTNLINAGTPETTITQDFLNCAEYQSLSNAQFVTSLYHDFFDRTPAPTEVANWQTALANGESPAQVVAAFDQSPEARQDLASQISGEAPDAACVAILYKGLLGRTATPAEVQSWADLIASGQNPASVAQDFLNSAEYQSLSNTQFVQGLYQGVLGRIASSAETLGWTSTLAGAAVRAQVATAFAQAPEAEQHWSVPIAPTSQLMGS